MKPTWGPLPWVITMPQPSLTMVTMWWQVSRAAMYWSRTVWWYRSLIRELPPIATTAIRLSTRIAPLSSSSAP